MSKSSHRLAPEFELAYVAAQKRLGHSAFRTGIAKRYGSTLPEDAFQQAVLEHWTYVVHDRLSERVYDGAHLDVDTEVIDLLSRTNLRLKSRLRRERREVLWLDEGWDTGDATEASESSADPTSLDDDVAARLDRQAVEQRRADIAAAAAPRGAQVLFLKEELGWDHEMIAEKLGISVENSRLILYRVRQALRAAGMDPCNGGAE